MEGITKQQVISSLGWKIAERFFTQGVGLVIQIILARILMPDDFGILAIILAITNYAGIFVQSGLSTAIVQKKELVSSDIGTLLVSSISIAAIMYIGLFAAAPFIASNYALPKLLWPLRVVAIVLFFNAINSVQSALYFREMRFKALFIRSVIAVSLSGTVSITMAYAGLGIWALVAHNVVNIVTIVVYMAFDSRVKLNWCFSWDRAKVLYAFSGKIMISNLISGFGDTLRTMIIGKKYTPDNLAYYDKAFTYSNYITQSITTSLSAVLLPTFSRRQDDKAHLKAMARQSVSMTTFLIIPLLTAVMMMAKPLVIILLTEKWAPCIPFLMIFCILRMPGCIISIDKQVFYAIGNSTINMYYEICILIVNVIMLYITVPISIMAIAIGYTIIELFGSLTIMIISRNTYGYKIRERIKDLILPIFYSLVMALTMYVITLLAYGDLLTLLLQILTGILTYIGLAYLFSDKNLYFIISIIKEKLTK